MMWNWSDGTPWWGWVVMCVTMVAFWVVVVGAIWYAVAHTTRSEQPPGRSPQQILDERFARGEIDADEYASRRAALSGVAPQDRTPAGASPAR